MRYLKWFAIILVAFVLILLLIPISIWGYYESIVGKQPGALATGATPALTGSEVNVFSATGGVPWLCGYNTPAAQVPWGGVRLGPDTASILTNTPALSGSGYYYGDNKIIGFSHTRLVGADAEEGGVFRVFPATDRTVEAARKADRYAHFSHREEKGFPGYYGVRLPKADILVELTATPRVGVHRYTFPAGAAPHLLLDVTSSFGNKRCEDAALLVYPDRRGLEGKVRTFGAFSGRYGGLDVYFAAQFSAHFDSYGTWTGERFDAGSDSAAGNAIGADLGFAAAAENVVELRLAISHVSMANAWENLKAEAEGKPFDDLLATAKQAWEQRLGAIRVSGGTDTEQRIFYTALYRTMQMPTVFEDTNGQYMGFDQQVHNADGYTYYTDFSLWDTFRNVHPLYTLIAPDAQRDMMVSLVEMVKAGGALPRWPSGRGYTNCMFGTPADVAISEAWLKGVRDFDIATAYASMRQVALEGVPAESKFAGREGLQESLRLGYCPDELSDSVAVTIEQGWSDKALSLLAADLGHTEDAAVFAEHSLNYRNLWNPETQYFQGRDSKGQFDPKLDPELLTYVDFDREYTRAYVEGSALQWRWAVPYDAEGLISLFSSREYFVSELERYFEGSRDEVGHWNPGGCYWHGNEPGIPAVYLFNAAGRPDLTQKWVRWIMATKYADDYVGLDGNDDGGTLSAWYVFSALGFYPIAGTTRYEIGSPIFESAELKMGGKTLRIVAENYAPDHPYVQQVKVNGTALDAWSFDHSQIADGGEIRFVMSATPRAAGQ